MAKNDSLAAALERLSKMNTNVSRDKVKYFACKEGKNNVLVLPLTRDGHPFAEWWVHKGLVDASKPWMAIACDKHNDGGECVICDMAQTLKDQNFKGNEDLWKPLEAIKEMYSPVIDINEMDAGVQWWSYGKSISGVFETWLRNIEDDEKPFYDPEAPQKIIVEYNKSAAPKDKYKLDRKNLKPIDSEQYDEWFAAIKPIDEVKNNRKSADEKEEILAAYVRGKEKALKAMTVDPSKSDVKKSETSSKAKSKIDEDDDEDEAPKKPSKPSKLSSLNDDEDED